jgi:hypothetical protein
MRRMDCGGLVVLMLSMSLSAYAETSCSAMTITASSGQPPMASRGPLPNSATGYTGNFPIGIELVPDLSTRQRDGTITVEYRLTNLGRQSLQMPIKTNQRLMTDLNGKKSVTVTIITLYVSSPNGASPLVTLNQQPNPPALTNNTLPVLEGQVFLYARKGFNQSWCSLAPGSTMRVIAKAKVPDGLSNIQMQGHAELLEEHFGPTTSSSEIGTASSKTLIVNDERSWR